MKKSSREALVNTDFRRHLLDVFQERAQARPSYSFRAFAKNLGVDPTTLRKIVSGKRPLGEKVMRQLAQKLRMPEEDLQLFLSVYKTRKKIGTLRADPTVGEFQTLTAEEFAKVTHWSCYAITELIGLPGFEESTEGVMKALRISRAEASHALGTLFQLGWIEKDAQGAWIAKVRRTTTDPSDPRIAKLRHQLMLEIAAKSTEALENIPRERRSHSAMTMAIDRHLLPEAMEKIRVFRMELADFLKKERKTNEVYQILVGVYPVSHLSED